MSEVAVCEEEAERKGADEGSQRAVFSSRPYQRYAFAQPLTCEAVSPFFISFSLSFFVGVCWVGVAGGWRGARKKAT